jgi:hypothetical protein
MGTTPHVRFSVAGLTTNAMISSLTGGRPGGVGWCHFPATNRRCDRSNVSGDTVRHVPIAVGGQRDNAAGMARSDQNSRGVGFARRNTGTSWRNAKISVSFHADDRDSNTNHDDSRIKIEYSNRTITTSDHGSPQITRSNPIAEFSTRTGNGHQESVERDLPSGDGGAVVGPGDP